MNVAFDLDGVITSQLEAIQIQSLTKFNKAVTEDMIQEFHWWKHSPLTKKQYYEIWSDSNTYKLMPMVSGAADSLRMIRDAGHNIYIITARYENLYHVTQQWLKDNKITWHFLQMGQKDKGEWFEKWKTAHSISLYVDDRMDNCKAVKSHADRVCLMDMGLPYTANVKRLGRIVRVKSWKDIVKQIIELEEPNHE